MQWVPIAPGASFFLLFLPVWKKFHPHFYKRNISFRFNNKINWAEISRNKFCHYQTWPNLSWMDHSPCVAVHISLSILCSEVPSLLLIANWDFLSPEVQLQASSHNYKGIIFIPYCKIKWFHLYSVIPIQSLLGIKGLTIKCNYMTTLLTTDLLVYYNGGLEVY